MTFEGYRLTLEHFIQFEGERHAIEEPLVVQSFFDRSFGGSASYCLNDMLQRMEEAVLCRSLNKTQRLVKNDSQE